MRATAHSDFAAHGLLELRHPSVARMLFACLLANAFLVLSSYLEVPMVPVPMTMQPFALTMVGALLGWRLGALTIIAWLGEAACGMPVLSGGASGLHCFVGPTAGYLFAFPLAGALVGLLTQRGWNGGRPILAFGAMLAGNATCLLFGFAWLSLLVGSSRAFMVGVAPFIVGALLNAALGAVTLWLLKRKQRSQGIA